MQILNKPIESQQQFHFYTSELWEAKKKDFSEGIQQQFQAKAQQYFVQVKDNSTQYFIGLGESKNANIQKISAHFSYSFKESFNTLASEIKNLEKYKELQDAFLGLYKGTYNYSKSDTHPFLQKQMQWHVSGFDTAELETLQALVKAVTQGEEFAMDWLNKPANLKPPKALLKALETQLSPLGITIKTLDKEACEKEGLGAYLSVNQASKDAAFTLLEYRPEKAEKHIGLVGKCVLFDTGGISIKPSQNMHYMKSDMGGACAVMGALLAVAKLQLPIHITAVLPITDNIINQEAYLPGDVVTAYNGKSIEVLNTDAEGRLTLADGLAYLTQNYKVDSVIDLATLTGSAVRMFGTTCAPVFSNSETLLKNIESSALTTAQKVWNMPLWDEWKEEINSDVADYKNISSKPYGDCIVAATFLKEFTNDHPQWAHLDIAGVAFGDVLYAKDKAATGYGVQLLLEYVHQLI